jgi:hypothetical protein
LRRRGYARARNELDSAPNTTPDGARVEIAVGSSASRIRGALATARAIATALLLAAGQLGRPVLEPLAQAEIAQQFGGTLARLLLREAADHLRQHHVLDRREFRQQVVKLIDEADLGAADARALGIRQRRGGGTVDIDFAAVGMFEQAGDVQERRLAGARTARSARPTGPATPQARRI